MPFINVVHWYMVSNEIPDLATSVCDVFDYPCDLDCFIVEFGSNPKR